MVEPKTWNGTYVHAYTLHTNLVHTHTRGRPRARYLALHRTNTNERPGKHIGDIQRILVKKMIAGEVAVDASTDDLLAVCGTILSQFK